MRSQLTVSSDLIAPLAEIAVKLFNKNYHFRLSVGYEILMKR
jgi:hypothetical protein